MLTPTPLLNLFSEKLDELQQKAGEERKAPRLPTTEGGRVFPAAQLDGHICMGSGSQLITASTQRRPGNATGFPEHRWKAVP